MKAIELQADVSSNHEIKLTLPKEVKAGSVKVIVMYEEDNVKQTEKRSFGQFQGQVRIKDDFDAPLPDSFWTGETAGNKDR